MITIADVGRAGATLGALILLSLVLLKPTIAHDSEQEMAITFPDCGTQSLYLLLRLEKIGVKLADLESTLAPMSETGHSMSELRDAGVKLGLRVRGIRLSEVSPNFDRPLLARLNRDPHGHFVVVRGVGHSGRLVQVLDPNLEPRIMEVSDLLKSPEWTGYVLVPIRTSSIHIAIQAISLLGSFFLAFRWFQYQQRFSRN